MLPETALLTYDEGIEAALSGSINFFNLGHNDLDLLNCMSMTFFWRLLF